MVKKTHPDSGHPEASVDRFHDVDQAFKVLQGKFAKQRRGLVEDMEAEVQIFDIKHTAPQHRQYLSYEGYGVGTPAQRERQYQQRKVFKAQERVLEHRMQKAQATEAAVIKKGEYYRKHAIKTKYGFDRVVEDLIQEAMSRGDFQNIKGAGKPLQDIQSQNPYVDFTTYKMNKILIDNGFTPEWIMLHKDIRENIDVLKSSLETARRSLGELPLTPLDQQRWETIQKDHEKLTNDINKKIDKFNLIVPVLEKQMVRIRLDKICDKVLCDAKVKNELEEADKMLKNDYQKVRSNQSNFMALIGSFFSGGA